MSDSFSRIADLEEFKDFRCKYPLVHIYVKEIPDPKSIGVIIENRDRTNLAGVSFTVPKDDSSHDQMILNEALVALYKRLK